MSSKIAKSLLALLFCLLLASASFAQEGPKEAEKLMTWQLTAIEKGDYPAFIQHGNRAFRELFMQFSFDTMSFSKGRKLAKGYKLDYLGAIERLGMTEHLWRVSIEGEKYQFLGSLTLANGKVAGFNLD